MSSATPSLEDNRHEDQLIKSLRARRGRASLGDVVVDTGLPKSTVEAQLRRLLSLYKSHLEVDENGELLYLFDPAFMRRGEDNRYLYKLGVQVWSIFKFLFKITIMVVLVVYFLLFLALFIASLVSGRSSDSSSSRRFNPIGLIWYGGGSRSSRRRSLLSDSENDSDQQPFYKKVFAFVFGPEAIRDDGDVLAEKKRLLEFIRANKGVVSTADLMAHTGLGVARAEEEMARILVEFEGDTHITAEGVILYTFQQLAISAMQLPTSPVEPSWRRLVEPAALTGNSGGVNALIGFLNGFNLFASLFVPQLAAAELGFSLSPLLWFGLGVFPFFFSLIFFAIPVVRWVLQRAEHARTSFDNTRRLLLREIMARPQEAVQAQGVVEAVIQTWPAHLGSSPSRASIINNFNALAFEAEAEQVNQSGESTFRFEQLGEQLEEARRFRTLIDPSELRLGRVVFSSDDEDTSLDEFEDRLTPQDITPMSQAQLLRADVELDGFQNRLSAENEQPVDADRQSQLDDFERRLAESAEVQVEVKATSKNS